MYEMVLLHTYDQFTLKTWTVYSNLTEYSNFSLNDYSIPCIILVPYIRVWKFE